jgi:CheY-like chemotaxis protein
LGSSEFLLEDLAEHHTWMLEEVLEIQKAGRKASSLTHQLLAFSRKQPLAPEVLDLNEVVREAFELLRRTVGEDVEIETGLRPDCGSCMADPHQLQQVLLNLVVNARDAMPAGGVITIATGRTTFDAHAVRRKPGSTPGTYVTIAVSDTGTGMSEATKARLFEPFFTTKEVGVGTGLGLATAYGIVKQSNGYIDVESELGEGSTFTVCLPLTRQAVGQSKPQPALARRGGNETILLAEDEEPVRLLARKVLERAGYQVLEARDGSEAAHMAGAFPGEIHAVVTDVVMPKRSGRELVGDLSRMGKDVRVLYMSGHADDAMQRHGVVEGRESFLRKPFTPDCLLATLRKLLDGGTAGPVARRCDAAARPSSLPSRVQDTTRQSLIANRLPDAFRTSNRQRSVT